MADGQLASVAPFNAAQGGGIAMDKITENISELIPQSLDDIIRKRRDEAKIRLAFESEIDALSAEIHFDQTNDVFDDWRLIAIVVKTRSGIEMVKIMLLGDSRNRECPRITSQVQQIDLLRNVLITRNTMYGLGRRGIGEPSTYHLISVCAALHNWGSGEAFGVPPFFY